MVNDAYIGFETAKLLKENSFNEKCEYCYAYFDDNDIRVFELKPNKMAQNLAENRYPCLSQQSAMAWLRKNNIFIDIDTIITTDKKVYYSASVGTIENVEQYVRKYCIAQICEYCTMEQLIQSGWLFDDEGTEED